MLESKIRSSGRIKIKTVPLPSIPRLTAQHEILENRVGAMQDFRSRKSFKPKKVSLHVATLEAPRVELFRRSSDFCLFRNAAEHALGDGLRTSRIQAQPSGSTFSNQAPDSTLDCVELKVDFRSKKSFESKKVYHSRS